MPIVTYTDNKAKCLKKQVKNDLETIINNKSEIGLRSIQSWIQILARLVGTF